MKIVSSPQAFSELLGLLSARSRFGFHVGATGPDLVTDRAKSLLIHLDGAPPLLLPLTQAELVDGLTWRFICRRMRLVFRDPTLLKVTAGLKPALHLLRNAGIAVAMPAVDVTLAAQLLEAAADEPPTASPLAAYDRLAPELEAAGLTRLLWELEMPLVPVIARMEEHGIHLEGWALESLRHELAESALATQARLALVVGDQVNLNSPKQLSALVYEHLRANGEPCGAAGDRSGRSTGAAALRAYVRHPLVADLLAHRHLTKMLSTYVDALPRLVHARTDRIHTTFHQLGTVTGRLSSAQPNLQNIPARSAVGREIRRAFRAQQPGHVLVSADYSQIELRLLAHLAGDAAMIRMFQSGGDIHTSTAAQIFGVCPERVSVLMRGRAKAINFGIVYGMTPFRLAGDTGLTVAQAKRFIARYFRAFPGVKRYISRQVEAAADGSFTVSMFGRRRRLPPKTRDGRRSKIAVNSPVQSSAADLVKLAMVKISAELAARGCATRLVLQVHDELVFEAPEQEVAEVVEVVRRVMETVAPLAVPMVADIGIGANWLSAHFS